MAVEIGRLVVQVRFGEPPAAPPADTAEALARLRRELLREIERRLAQAERRGWER